ncbi:hypothetical protein Tco_0142536, partial [Tanacetum coccineum]
MVQDGKVVVQDVRGRYNANNQGRPFQRNNARGNSVAGNVEGQSDFKDKMLLMQAQESGAVLDEEQSLFLAGEQVTNVDDDSPENDLALNMDHVLEADECDAFDSDVDEDEYHEVHEMQTDEQHSYVDEQMEDHVVQRNVYSVRNDALMSILDEMHEHGVQSRLANKPDKIIKDSVASELARYK